MAKVTSRHNIRRAAFAAATALVTTTALVTPVHAVGIDVVNHVNTDKQQDTVFVIDTTASMEDDIDDVKKDTTALIEKILATNPGSRIGIVEYRDWVIPFTDGTNHSAARTVINLTRDKNALINAINGLQVFGEGNEDYPEDTLTGIVTAYQQPWRSGVARNVIVIGDDRAHDPECATGLTYKDIIDWGQGKDLNVNVTNRNNNGLTDSTGCSISPEVTAADRDRFAHLAASDTNTAIGIIVPDEVRNSTTYAEIAAQTGGFTLEYQPGKLADAFTAATNTLTKKPVAKLSGPDQGHIDEKVTFTSVDNEVYVPGDPAMFIDFGDGSSPVNISSGRATHVYTTPGTYTVTVTLTDPEGGTAVATHSIMIDKHVNNDPTHGPDDSATENDTTTPRGDTQSAGGEGDTTLPVIIGILVVVGAIAAGLASNPMLLLPRL